MEQVEKFIHWLNDNIVWGPVMLVLLVGTGIWLTLILCGLQFGMLFYALKQAFRPYPKKDDGSDHEGDVSHFGALMTALSATIGTGNIAGVATAVVTGGPGAVFWMWITAIFAAARLRGGTLSEVAGQERGLRRAAFGSLSGTSAVAAFAKAPHTKEKGGEFRLFLLYDLPFSEGVSHDRQAKIHKTECSGRFEKCRLGGRSRSEERRVGKECRSRWSPYH